MASFEFHSQSTRGSGVLLTRVLMCRKRRRCRLAPGADNSIQRRLSFSAAGDDPEGAVGADRDVRDVEWAALKEGLGPGAVTSAARSQVYGENSAVGPVENKEGFLIVIGEASASAKCDGGRRAAADIERWQGVVGMIRKI